MSNLTVASSSEEIEDEIIFTQTLLDSLDPGSETFLEEKKHFQEVMQYLDGLLQAKSTGNNQSFAEESSSAGWGDQSVSYPYLDDSIAGGDNQFPTLHDDYSIDTTRAGPTNGHLKRPREPSFAGPPMTYEMKSRRTTPDLAFGTPSSAGSLEQMEEFDLRNRSLFPKSSSQQALERRRLAERNAYEQVVQQRRDNEMARALEDANRNMSGSRSGPTSLPFSTWVGPRPTSSHVAYDQLAGMGPPAPQVDSWNSSQDNSSPSSSPVSVEFQGSASRPNRYDRPLPYLPSPNNATSGSSNRDTVQGPPPLKVEPQDSNSAIIVNGGSAEIVDLTGNSSEEENTSAASANPYPVGLDTTYGATQYPQHYTLDDPYADLNQHQNYLSERAQAMPESYTDSNGSWFQAYNTIANGVQHFGQAVGGLASSLNPFGVQSNGVQAGPAGYSSYGDSSGFNGYGGYANGYDRAGPSNPLIGDPLDNYLQNPARHNYDYLYSDPTKTREEINDLLQNISADEDLPPELRGDTPEPMKTTLMPHQLLGLKWLTKMEESKNQGGILADDMGLGKTIQALALMVTRRSEDKLRKTTLIVAPVALLRQWKREIEEKIKPTHRLNVMIFHGSQSNMTYNRLRQYDVVLTTFGKLGTELKRQQKYEFRLTTDRDARPRKDEEVCLIGNECKWYRVIIDEAQCIKNKNTQVSQAACKLHAKYRLCMTGTPMMNNVEELYSLIRFLRIKPYCHWEDFRKDFAKPLKDSYKFTKDQAMKKLQALLKAILLRRTKTTKIDGQPIIRIPERSVEESHAVFSEDELQVYKSLEQNSQLTFNKYLRAGTVGKNYSNMLTLLLRLRQCCCHPHLMKDWNVTAEQVSEDPDRMPELAKKLAPNVVQRIKDANGNFECPVCYDAVENPAIFFPCGHDTCMECFASLSDPSRAIREGDESASAKCPECRGPIKRSDLLDYKTFKKVHMPETLAEGDGDGEAAAEDDDSDSDSDDSDDDADDVDDHGNLKDFIVEDGQEEAEETDDEENEAESSTKSKRKAGKHSGRPKDVKGKGKAKRKNKTQTLAELKRLGMRNQKAKMKYLKKLRKDYVSSSKIDQTLDILTSIRDNDPREKTIIFSQWTSLLDLLEIALSAKPQLGAFARYDGSMHANARNDAVNSFLDDPRVGIMLVSLKAGNAGLNLTAASQVIILDPFWNPFIEEQAIDRAHRIGQQREVRVHRVLVRETVEDRIVALQEKKRELITTALDEGESKKLGRLSTGELAYLFGVSHNPNGN
ncbi:MAG: hypothetical protein Q9157_006391 [Trypethelium eluteriae]